MIVTSADLQGTILYIDEVTALVKGSRRGDTGDELSLLLRNRLIAITVIIGHQECWRVTGIARIIAVHRCKNVGHRIQLITPGDTMYRKVAEYRRITCGNIRSQAEQHRLPLTDRNNAPFEETVLPDDIVGDLRIREWLLVIQTWRTNDRLQPQRRASGRNTCPWLHLRVIRITRDTRKCRATGTGTVVMGDRVVHDTHIQCVLKCDTTTRNTRDVIHDHVVQNVHLIPLGVIIRVVGDIITIDTLQHDAAAVTGTRMVALDQVGIDLDVTRTTGKGIGADDLVTAGD